MEAGTERGRRVGEGGERGEGLDGGRVGRIADKKKVVGAVD